MVLDEIAVLCLPGAESRRLEVAGVADVLRRYRMLESIRLPGTLDGGDLLRVGNVIYAGLSTRSNRDGIEQLRGIVERLKDADIEYITIHVDTGQVEITRKERILI